MILLTCSSCATWSTAPLPVEMTSLEGVVDEVMVAGWYLGVEVAPNESDSLDELEVRPGVRLTAVSKDSPAQEAGLQVGDILLSWEQTSINDAGRLETLLRQGQAPRIVTLRLERGARVFEQQVALSMRSTAPKPRTLYHVDRYLLRAGFRDEKTLQALPVIAWLAEDSPLRVAGAKRGDRILTFAGLDPGSAEELVRRVRFSLESGASFTVEVERGGEQISLEGTAWQAPR
ncbi:MAG: PDZ domain-containing protein, partial [Planctomycetes bacterium]|nr:PDZ domain-containing protein [Planctomycetota bacterium]